jgi:hypothetical protein
MMMKRGMMNTSQSLKREGKRKGAEAPKVYISPQPADRSQALSASIMRS